MAQSPQNITQLLADWSKADVRVSLDKPTVITKGKNANLVALDEALNRLAEIDSRQARIVELRFFGGLSVAETAEVLGIPPARTFTFLAKVAQSLWLRLGFQALVVSRRKEFGGLGCRPGCQRLTS